VARPGSLLLLKRSHLDDAREWHKHIVDYHFLKKRVPVSSITAAERSAYARRCLERAAQGSSIEPSMQVPNEVFFARYKHDAIRLFVHDDLHRATCHYDEPLYQRLKVDRSHAYVRRDRFRRLAREDKIRLVLEESYAMALERVVLPARELGVACSTRHAFLHALHRICTDLTRGWFRDFAIEHYPEIAADNSDFVGRFDDAVRRGVIQRQAPARLTRTTRAALRAQLSRIAARDVHSALPRVSAGEVRDPATL
jgi:hypothetical protein